jgi:hypothetical protein
MESAALKGCSGKIGLLTIEHLTDIDKQIFVHCYIKGFEPAYSMVNARPSFRANDLNPVTISGSFKAYRVKPRTPTPSLPGSLKGTVRPHLGHDESCRKELEGEGEVAALRD